MAGHKSHGVTRTLWFELLLPTVLVIVTGAGTTMVVKNPNVAVTRPMPRADQKDFS